MNYSIDTIIKDFISTRNTKMLTEVFKKDKMSLLCVIKELYEMNNYRFELVINETSQTGLLYFSQNSRKPDVIICAINDSNVERNLVIGNMMRLEQLGKEYSCSQFSLISVFGYDKSILDEFKGFNVKLLDLAYLYSMFGSLSSGHTFIELFEHNYTAYNDMLECLESKGRAAVVQATGTGKGYIMGKYITNNTNKKI